MKVLFLDVDGVLNKTSDWEVLVDSPSLNRLNATLVARLKEIVKETDCKIVLSSTWRKDQEAIDFLKEAGVEVYDVTDDYGSIRGNQIQRWLDSKGMKTEKYVIVDDNSDMLHHQLPYFIQTDIAHGLTETLAYRIKRRLNRVIPS